MKIVLAVFFTSLTYGLIINVNKRYLFIAPLVGVGGYLVYLELLKNYDIFFATAFASGLITLFSEIASRLYKAPATIFLITSIIALVPGGFLYYTMEALIKKTDMVSFYFSQTIYSILGMAAGIVAVWIVFDIFNRYLAKIKNS